MLAIVSLGEVCLFGSGDAHAGEPRGPGTCRCRVLDDEWSERGETSSRRERRPEGDHAVGDQRVIPHAEQQLVRQVVEAVHHGRGAEQQHSPAHQPRRHMRVAPGERVPEVMALVDDHEAGRPGRQAAATRELVRADLDRDTHALGDRAPLRGQRRGHQASGGAPALEQAGDGQGHVSLAASNRVGEQCAAVALERGHRAPEAARLPGEQPRGRTARMLGGREAPGQRASYFRRHWPAGPP